jgi:hypothetical protein
MQSLCVCVLRLSLMGLEIMMGLVDHGLGLDRIGSDGMESHDDAWRERWTVHVDMRKGRRVGRVVIVLLCQDQTQPFPLHSTYVRSRGGDGHGY